MFNYLTDLVERYVCEPNSSLIDEELFNKVLSHIIDSEKVAESDKIRPRRLRRQIAMNRPGTLAADFAFEMSNGRRSLMTAIRADYLLVYFYNLDCPDCKAVKRQIESSPLICSMINSRQLKVLALYPGNDHAQWRKSLYDMPIQWLNAYDPRGVVKDILYAIDTIPSLYLLGSDKTVILKDATPENIENWLLDQTNGRCDNA